MTAKRFGPHRAACLNWGWITEFLPCALMWKNCLYGIIWRILSCVVVLSAFWPVPVQGITEIYRVLKPGGCAIVGVGAGRYMPETMRRRIYESMSASDRTTSPANILLKITMPLPVRPCCRITASLSRMIYPKDVGWK